MRHRTIAFFVCMILCGIGVPSHAAEISGAWKIETHGGPVPLCSLVQTGNDLSGSCVGPQAAGTISGTVAGPTVRWRWQWVTNSGDKAGAFDFLGTLGADNTITGTVERREIGLSLNFTATRQSSAAGAMRSGAPDGGASPAGANQSLFNAAEISGSWKINTRGGPVPLCNLTQVGNNLNGSCIGPQAAGIVSGTVAGNLVRWHWQWITYVGNAAGAFDFVGNLQSDNTITGTVERREIGLSFDFAATRQSIDSGVTNQSLSQFIDEFNKRSGSNVSVGVAIAPGAPIKSGTRMPAQPATVPGPNNTLPRHLNNSFEEARAYYVKGASAVVIANARQISPDLASLSDAQIRQRLVPSLTRQGMQAGEWIDRQSSVIVLGDARSISLQEGWNTSETAFIGNADIDPQIEARALKLFPLASQINKRTQYIVDEMNAAADRQQGNSYSIHVR